MKFVFPSVLVFVSLSLAGYFVYVSTDRNLTPLEGIFFQVLILIFGLGGTFWIGLVSPISRSHARSAFRRVRSLYMGLARAALIIDESRDSDSVAGYRLAFARLEEVVGDQLVTADDALEDWEDIVPKDVRELRKRLGDESSGRSKW